MATISPQHFQSTFYRCNYLQLLTNSLGYHFSKTRNNFIESVTGSWSQCSAGNPLSNLGDSKHEIVALPKTRGLALDNIVVEKWKFGWTSSWEQHDRTMRDLSPAVARWRNRWFLFSGGGLGVSGCLTWFPLRRLPQSRLSLSGQGSAGQALWSTWCCVVQLSHS